jgi:hypothetical protein
MGVAAALLIAPLQQLQVVFGRVVAVPVDPVVLVDAGFLVGGPDLHRPEQRAQVLVHPVLRAGDDLLGVVLEVVEGADRRVAGEPGADVGQALDHPQVFGRHVVVGHGAHGPQDHARMRVEADRRADVGVLDDEVDHGPHFGLARGVGAGAELFVFLAPEGREVAVQVQALAVAVHLDLQAVEVDEGALGHHPVVGAAELARLARDHQPRLVGVALPGAVRVGHAHLQHAAVAVDVLDRQAVHRLLVERIGPGGRADEARLVGQRQLGAVGVQARAEVDHPGVEQLGDPGIAAMPGHQLVQPVQAGGAGRQLTGMDVAVDPDGRLVLVIAGGAVGDDHQRDVTPFVALAQHPQVDQVRPGIGVGLRAAAVSSAWR